MTEDQAAPEVPDRVECPAARDPAVRAFIIAAMFAGFGIWCLTDRRAVPEEWTLSKANEIGAYLLNNWGPFLFLPVAAVSAVWGIVALRRRLVADQEGIGYVGREKVAWKDVTRLDTTKAGKGILVLHHASAGGQGALKLDSYKLQNFRELALLIESKVPVEA